MPEVITLGEVHVEHRHKGARHDEVENPLECYGNGHGSTTDGVRENLGDEHPADGTPREHERGRVDHDGDGCHKFHARVAESDGYTEGTESHTQRTVDEQGLASPFLHGEDGYQGKQNVDDTHKHGHHHRVLHTHVTEDARSIVEHSVDAHSLLEHGEHDTHEDAQGTVGHQFLGLHGHRLLDILENLCRFLRTVDLREDTKGFLVLTNTHQVARRLGNEADKQGEETCRDSLGTKHVAPTGSNGPLCFGGDGGNAFAHLLHHRLDMVAQNEEVDEIDN